MALDIPIFHNECRTVEIGGFFYDFATAEDAAIFARTVENGTPPRLAYSLLTDRRIFPKPMH
jgi:hypothetical protein